MAREIDYLDIDRHLYETSDKDREDMNKALMNYKIINIETSESIIRFWYYKEY